MRLDSELDQLHEKNLQTLDPHLQKIIELGIAFLSDGHPNSILVFRCLFLVGAMLHKRRADIDSLEDGGGK